MPHAAPPTVHAAAARAQARGLARIDAHMLLLHALQRPVHDRAWLLAHDSDALTPQQAAQYGALCRRRLDGEPLAYITGRKAFYGLELHVDGRVLDPRADTETLVNWALDISRSSGASTTWHVADIGTGSGAIALALKHQRPHACVWATDASAQALAVARANAQRLGLPLHLAQGDWLAALPQAMRFDCIVSNPPYIRAGDPHLSALHHEPQQALVSGADGLDAIRTLIASAPQHLEPGGWLLLEHGWDQGASVAALLRAPPWARVQQRQDLAGVPRCTGAVYSPATFSAH